ncbi:MAG: hypothetical protein COA78_12410 [Blastopirellula sp.]|nr:MAG: hypothetical protein COA78_12410 [Blastopirellula sp.]
MEVSKPENTEENLLWHRRTLWVIGSLLVFRLCYLWLFPVGLVHDEAYYWDWSRSLDWGYYSKPPMIAWIIAASTRMLGSSEYTVRLPAVLLATSGLYFIYLLTARMFSSRIGFWAVLLSALTPGNVAMGLLMTIDAPFIFLWCAALYCFWRMLERDQHRLTWLLLTVCVIGLGVLTKQTMLGFLAFGGLFILISKEDRKELFQPGLWLCALGSLIFLTPVLYWNWQNDWITAQHTGEHFQNESVDLSIRFLRSLEFLGGLLGVISPVTFVLTSIILVAGFWSIRNLGRKEKYLLCFSAIPLSLVLMLSFKQRIELNWPAAFFPAAMVLVAAWAHKQTSIKAWLTPQTYYLRNAAVVGAVFTCITYAMPFAIELFNLEGSKIDAVVRLRGWGELGDEISAELKGLSLRDDTLFVVTAGRGVTAELTFYLENQPKVYLWKDTTDITSQYDVWGGPRNAANRQAVIVTNWDEPVPQGLASAFSSIRSISRVTVPINETRSLDFRIWLAEDCSAWPPNGTAVVAKDNLGSTHR